MSKAKTSAAPPVVAADGAGPARRLLLSDTNVVIGLIGTVFLGGWYLRTQFEATDRKSDRLHEKFDRLNEKFDSMIKNQSEVSARLGRLEETVTDLRLKLVAVEIRLSESDRRRQDVSTNQ